MSSTVRYVGVAALTITLSMPVSGCATYSDRTARMRSDLQRGDGAGGLNEINDVLDVDSADRLPQKWKRNTALALLERATVLQALREYLLSARDYEAADQELELLDIARDTIGNIGQFVYSDAAPKYKTSPTEKLALNAVNMVNFLVRGDLEGAAVEARRFTVMRNYLRDYDPEHEHGAFGSYLAGFVFERLGDPDRALRYYEEALQEREFASLQGPIVHLAGRSGFRGPRIRSYLPTEPAPVESVATEEPDADGTSEPPTRSLPSSPSEILIIAKVGRVPYKEPRRIPIGAAIGIASAWITGDPTILEYGMFKVVTYPELVPSESLFDSAAVMVDGKAIRTELATDMASEIVREWEDIKPRVIGAAITRMITRAVAAEGARAAGRQAKGDAGPLVGFLAAAAVEGTLVALDKPDTRSWTTLPARIYVARVSVPAGEHHVEVSTTGPGGREAHGLRVTVKEGGFAVVDVTTLR